MPMVAGVDVAALAQVDEQVKLIGGKR